MSVSVGSTDSSLVMQGGAALEKRMQDFQGAKKNAEEALANLQLARSAKDVYADAQRQRGQAKKALADANANAAEIVRSARAEADRVRADVATEMRRASQVSAAADAADSLAKKRLAEADAAVQRAAALEKQHTDGAAGARAAQNKADNLIAKLHEVMNQHG